MAAVCVRGTLIALGVGDSGVFSIARIPYKKRAGRQDRIVIVCRLFSRGFNRLKYKIRVLFDLQYKAF